MQPRSQADLATSVYVKGISRNSTEDDIRAAFSSFGTITEIITKEGRNFALVCYNDVAAVQATFDGCPISVANQEVTVEPRNPKEKKPAQPSCNVYLNNLNGSVTEEQVGAALANFGTILKVTVQADRGFAYAQFEQEEAAVAAVQASPIGADWNVEFRRSRVSRPRQQRAPKEVTFQIYVKGLDESCDEDALRQAFGSFGTVLSVDRRDIERDFGFVQYESAEVVEAAVAAGEAGNVTVNGIEVVVEARKNGSGAGKRRNRRRRRRTADDVEA